MSCHLKTRSHVMRCMLCVLVLSLLFSSAVALAQHRTLYKPQDIENARRNIELYEWAQEIVGGWEEAAQYAMQQNRDFFEEFIPELSPGTHRGQNCPVCADQRWQAGGLRFGGDLRQWTVRNPDQIACSICRTAYPSEEYPETGVLEMPRMGQTFTYYETPEERALPPDATAEERARHALRSPGRDHPTMTSFTGVIRDQKVRWAIGQASLLARLYAVTDDIAYAERVAWILDRFARVYPNYLWGCYGHAYADAPPAEVAENMERGLPPDVVRGAYGLNRSGQPLVDPGTGLSKLSSGFWGSGRFRRHADEDGPLLELTVAFDLIRDAQYPDGRRLVDEEMDQRIMDDLIVAGCTDWEHWGLGSRISNKGTGFITLTAAVGVLQQNPERVRRALFEAEQLFADKYHFDGFSAESLSYGIMFYGGIRYLPDILMGYSDPPDYQPEEGPRLENLDLYAQAGPFRMALLAFVRPLAPGNVLPPIAHTGPGRSIGLQYAEILAAPFGGHYAAMLEELQGRKLSERGSQYCLWHRPPDLQVPEGPVGSPLRSEWFPGWHVGVLRGGSPADTALYLVGDEHRWTVRSGHRERDTLALAYYAYGEELAADRGHFGSGGQLAPDGRPGTRWTSSTISHNLVVVDGRNQGGSPSGSNLELFGVTPGIEVLQASGFNVYEQCDEYRRTMALMQKPGGETYVVDFFRVAGGQTHQYSFHCNGSLVALQPAQPAPQPLDEELDWRSTLRAVSPEQPYTFTWQHRDVNLDLMLLNDRQTLERIIIADAPGWRSFSRIEDEADIPQIQQILAENRAADGAEAVRSQYAAVIVPYREERSPVVAARLLDNDYESGAIAVEVQFAERTDYIISARDRQQRQYGPVTVAGEFAFVSVDNGGNVLQAYLLAGTHLQYGDTVLELPRATTTLAVASVSDRTFNLAEPLPAELAESAWFVLSDGPEPSDEEYPRPRTGFEIESTTANSITVRHYPVVECDEVTILHAAWLEAGA